MEVPGVRTWTINGDFLALRPNGVVRYAEEVTRALDALVTERHPSTAGLRLQIVAPCQPAAPLSFRSIPIRIVREWKKPRIPQFWVQGQLPWYVSGGLLSFCNLGPVMARRQIICMHDIQTRLVKQSYGWGFRLVHRLLMPLLGRSCYAVTTVSKFSERHLRSFGVVPEDKLLVTYNGHEHAVRWDPYRSTLPLDGKRPFVLALGRGEKHKNRNLLREIAHPLDRMGLDLFVAGDVDPRVLMRDGETDLPSNLRLLGRISDDDLAKALDHALCFLFPSLMEGFGLPGLEAMARGCPVIVSDAACLPEIYGDAALYAPPQDLSAWADQVGRLAGDPRLRQAMCEKGRARAELYSWRAIAEQYLDVMARADAGRSVSCHVRDRITEGHRAELQPP